MPGIRVISPCGLSVQSGWDRLRAIVACSLLAVTLGYPGLLRLSHVTSEKKQK